MQWLDGTYTKSGDQTKGLNRSSDEKFWVIFVISVILPVVVPTFFMILLGFLWSRSGRDFPTAFVAQLVTLIGAPFLVFSTLANAELDPGSLGQMLAASAIYHVAMGVVGALSLYLAGWNVRSFVASFAIGNGGNVGLPISLFAFGELGLAFGITFFVVQSLLFFTVGAYFYSGKGGFRQILKMPMPFAALLGLGVMLSSWDMPDTLYNIVTLAGSFVIPMMLMTLGVSLSRLQVSDLRSAVFFTIFRFAVAFGIAHVITELMALDGVMKGVLLLQATMPVAVFNFMFATLYDRSPERIAGIVFVSTALMFVTLPLMVAYTASMGLR